MEQMGLLTIFYWILLLLWLIGAIAPPNWEYWPRASNILLLVLFVIIGIKMLKPAW